MRIFAQYAYAFEQVGIDEAYLEPRVKGYGAGDKEVKRIVNKIKDEVRKKTRLTCSIGIGPNKLVAKIASDMQKPDGLVIVRPRQVQQFLDPLPATAIPGIGPKSAWVLRKLGVDTIRSLRRISKKTLVEHFGAWGEDMHGRAHGRDDRPVEKREAAKSLGRQETFEKNTLNPTVVLSTLKRLSNRVARDTKEEKVRFKTVELTVRFANFFTPSRQTTLSNPISSATVLHLTALQLLLPFLDRRENPRRIPIRLLGVRVSALEPQDRDAV